MTAQALALQLDGRPAAAFRSCPVAAPRSRRWRLCDLLLAGLVVLCAGCVRAPRTLLGATGRQNSAQVEAALLAARDNRPEIERALVRTPPAQQDAIRFLIANMPAADLQVLRSNFLLENLELAYRAYEDAPWHEDVPQDVFLEAVLPYACASEPRQAWRAQFYSVLQPVVLGSSTSSRAAQRLNETIWEQFGVKYSPQRLRPDQSPAQSMKLGTASCTGLSIFLCLACRSVGVPSRVVGLDAWPHKPGNHTWVEIWDQGEWRCVGAAEPEHAVGSGWFLKEARLARQDEPRHAIWAVSFGRTGQILPLGWARDIPLEGVNVTERYAPAELPGEGER